MTLVTVVCSVQSMIISSSKNLLIKHFFFIIDPQVETNIGPTGAQFFRTRTRWPQHHESGSVSQHTHSLQSNKDNKQNLLCLFARCWVWPWRHLCSNVPFSSHQSPLSLSFCLSSSSLHLTEVDAWHGKTPETSSIQSDLNSSTVHRLSVFGLFLPFSSFTSFSPISVCFIWTEDTSSFF